MRNNIAEEIDEDFTVRLIDNKARITNFNYTPSSINELWENVERYLAYCKEQEKKVTLDIAFEFTNTPYWIFSDYRTQEIIKLYFAMKQNPMFLFGSIEQTPTLWIDAVSTLNQLWSQ
jgi:hypothetical protein